MAGYAALNLYAVRALGVPGVSERRTHLGARSESGGGFHGPSPALLIAFSGIWGCSQWETWSQKRAKV